MERTIITIEKKANERYLRKKPPDFDFDSTTRRERQELVNEMTIAMRHANGIGLSANQIGVDVRVFVAEVPFSNGKPKFYSVFNPTIEKKSTTVSVVEEGCLSIPGTYGEVSRSERVTLRGRDINGKILKIKAWGLLARVFQHEVDHLEGKLFIHKAKNVHRAEFFSEDR